MKQELKTADDNPARPKTSQEHVVEWLRHAIVNRDFRPGEKVRQEDIAERAGVSIVPVREAMRVLEQEGQLTYRPRRGHFVTELRIEDLEEIYGLRDLLEEQAVRYTMGSLDSDRKVRLAAAALECRDAATRRDVLAELGANRVFHFSLMDASGHPHTLGIIRKLWDQTEAYRALYYNLKEESNAALDAHDQIVAATLADQVDEVVVLLREHRNRALDVLRGILAD